MTLHLERGAARSNIDLSFTEPWFRDTRATLAGVDLQHATARLSSGTGTAQLTTARCGAAARCASGGRRASRPLHARLRALPARGRRPSCSATGYASFAQLSWRSPARRGRAQTHLAGRAGAAAQQHATIPSTRPAARGWSHQRVRRRLFGGRSTTTRPRGPALVRSAGAPRPGHHGALPGRRARRLRPPAHPCRLTSASGSAADLRRRARLRRLLDRAGREHPHRLHDAVALDDTDGRAPTRCAATSRRRIPAAAWCTILTLEEQFPIVHPVHGVALLRRRQHVERARRIQPLRPARASGAGVRVEIPILGNLGLRLRLRIRPGAARVARPLPARQLLLLTGADMRRPVEPGRPARAGSAGVAVVVLALALAAAPRRPRTSASATSTRPASSRTTRSRRRRSSASTASPGWRDEADERRRRSTRCAPRCATSRRPCSAESGRRRRAAAAEGASASTTSSSRTSGGRRAAPRRRTSELTARGHRGRSAGGREDRHREGLRPGARRRPTAIDLRRQSLDLTAACSTNCEGQPRDQAGADRGAERSRHDRAHARPSSPPSCGGAVVGDGGARDPRRGRASARPGRATSPSSPTRATTRT